MPITKSAKRALRKSQKNRAHNLKASNILKASIKDALNLIKKKDAKAGKAVSGVYSLADKAAKKRIISKQRAGRIKGKLAKALSEAKLKPGKRDVVKVTAKPKKASKKKAAAKPKKATPKKKKTGTGKKKATAKKSK